MKKMLVLAGFLTVAWASSHLVTQNEEWNEYKKSFAKFYASGREDAMRLNAYLETKRRVEEHNMKYERGETSYTMEINKFADWFPDELKKLNGFKIVKNFRSEGEVFKLPPGVKVPNEMNWVTKGAVTSVKDQGRCGSCYAFSAVGALEGLMYNTNKTITDLSPQELVDCTLGFGNSGCNGGWMDNCFRYVAFKKGITTDKSYPYEHALKSCRARKGKKGATCVGYKSLMRSEADMKNAVDGIFDGNCSSKVNHAMLAVGYGKDNKTGKDYWLIKNSWGKGWGLKGYSKIIRGVGKCDIHLYSSYPVIRK